MKKDVLKNIKKITRKHLCQSLFSKNLFFNSIYLSSSSNIENKGSFIKTDTQTQVLFCEFCKIFKNIFCRSPPSITLSTKQFARWQTFVQCSFTKTFFSDNMILLLYHWTVKLLSLRLKTKQTKIYFNTKKSKIYFTTQISQDKQGF